MSQTKGVVGVLLPSHSRSESDGGMLLSMVTIPATPPILSYTEASVERHPSMLDLRALRRTDSLFPPNNSHAVQIVHTLNQR